MLKLAKLLYLADREFLDRYDMPILFDKLVSMPHGPVTSMTYNYVNGYEVDRGGWSEFVNDRADYQLGLARPDITIDDLDELSKAELRVLDAIWEKFGGMKPFELRDYTHQHCPEWEDPNGSSTPIPYQRVLKFLGKENSQDIESEIEALRSLDESLAHAR
ncbi:Panacea domain-containing protein [Tardiphaga alba]|uniref:Panacea domain-containing protein n=1 Tax=Tardiphaga alba TaxID=340268 RepID=UPI002011E515|nr:Panacea domain-containing protein [Tardiphaga alba]